MYSNGLVCGAVDRKTEKQVCSGDLDFEPLGPEANHMERKRFNKFYLQTWNNIRTLKKPEVLKCKQKAGHAGQVSD